MAQKEQTTNQEHQSVFVRKVWLSPLFYVYFLVMLTALGMLYVHRENMINRNSIPPDLAVDSIYNKPISDVPPGPSDTGTKIDISNLLQPTKAQLERGESLYKMDCAPCHGVDGKGDGPAAASLNPKPRDFHSTTGWVNGRFLSQMFRTVSEGISGTAMVSFAASISPSDRLAIIDYIRTNFGDFPKDTPEQLETMNKTYKLEKVEAPSARIPVSEAMKQVEEEAIPLARTNSRVLSYISRHPEDEGARIFYRVVINERRALTVLGTSGFWSKNESDFVKLVTAEAVQNGFDPKVALLSNNEWQTLYMYLKNLFLKNSIVANQ
jgi:mono/diheme cytochrome c family protein